MAGFYQADVDTMVCQGKPCLVGKLQLDDAVLAQFHDCRKRQTTPILAYLVLEALSMLIMAILIILILIGLGEAGSAAADEIANGKYEMDGSHGSEWSKTA